MNEIDSRIFKKASRGDSRAFKELYDWYAPFVWRLVFRSGGGDRNVVQEIVQDTFIRVYRSMRKFRMESSISTWLYRIAYNSSLAYFAKNKNRNQLSVELNESMPGKDHTDKYETDQLISRALNSLSAEDRFLLTAREVDGISFEELTVITGKNGGALRTRLHRIKQDIRDQFLDKPETKEDTHEVRGTILQNTGTDA